MKMDLLPTPCSGSPALSPPGLQARLFSAYAGIGSRATPALALDRITRLGEILARCGLTLRSGGAPGADLAFEKGADLIGGRKQIFLPWRGFNKSSSPLYQPPPEAYQIAGTVHPYWERCKPATRKLHARNCQQVLGKNLDHPVSFVLFWAPEEEGVVCGGTATAVHLAQRRGIPTYNLWRPEVRARWAALVGEGAG